MYKQVAPAPKWVWGHPGFILKFKFQQHKQPIGKVWQKSHGRFYFRGITLRLTKTLTS